MSRVVLSLNFEVEKRESETHVVFLLAAEIHNIFCIL